MRLGSDITLLHVCSTWEGEFLSAHREYIERAAETLSRQSEVVAWTSTRLQSRRARVRGELTVGHPADEILRYAEDNNVDIIIMSARGRSGIRRWAVGGIADKVLRASSVPVLLVRGYVPEEALHDEWPGRAILVPLDGSEFAESVLPHVEALAKQVGTQRECVVLLGVCEPLTAPSFHPGVTPEEQQADLGKRRQSSEAYLVSVQERLQSAGIRATFRVLVGRAAEQIVEYSYANPQSLIVMASHGQSGPARWVYGSVAHRVLLGASAPLLMVRPSCQPQ